MSRKQFQIIQQLAQHALDGQMNHKHAACIVKGGKVMRVAINSCSGHAEQLLLFQKGHERSCLL